MKHNKPWNNKQLLFLHDFSHPLVAPSILNSDNKVYPATADAFAQIGSLHSPTSNTSKTLYEIIDEMEGALSMYNVAIDIILR